MEWIKTYYIYHIPGIKIGCSEDPKGRVKRQGYDNYEILEEYTDIHEASRREHELQRQYGYYVDKSLYSEFIHRVPKEARRRGGITAGNNQKDNLSRIALENAGKYNRRNITFEQAEEIRSKHQGKYGDTKRLAEEYGIYKSTVTRIIKNQLYARKYN